MILDHAQNVLALCGGHFSFGQLGGRSVYLQPFGSQLCGRVYRFGNGFTEGFQNNADGEIDTSLHLRKVISYVETLCMVDLFTSVLYTFREK